MIEEWKDVKGYEGLYQVSNLGRVKSLKFGKERILKPALDKYGYMYVHLYKNSTRKTVKVHRLAIEAFIQNQENKPQVNHIDEDKTNNVVSNLEWVTAKENTNHGTRNLRSALSNGTKIRAIDIGNGEQNEYYSIRECARQLNISQGDISNLLKGKYKQVGGYIFEYSK